MRRLSRMSSKWDKRDLDRTQRVLQAWTTRNPAAAKAEAAVLRQAIADADWDTVERHGGLNGVVDKIDQAQEEMAASAGAGKPGAQGPADRSTISAFGGLGGVVVSMRH